WERVVADALAGRLSGDPRVALLGHLSALIPEPPRAQAVAVTPLGTFEGADDLSREDPLARISRWEHWWDDEPPTWPPRRKPRSDEVLAALGRLDFHLRRLLILRDVALLSAEDARMITSSDEDASEVPLQLARDAYVVELDREIGGR